MKRSLCLFMLAIALGLSATSFAQTGGASSPFALGVGSRDLALGGADLASCDFATAPYWNASRLARSERLSILGFHTRLFESDVAYQYLGIVIPTLDWGGIGIGIARLGVSDIERRDESNLLLGTFSDNRLNLRVAYGRTFGSFDVGASVSVETHSLDTYHATSTPGLDLAVSRPIASPLPWCESVTLTVVGRNLIAPSLRLADEPVKSPQEWHAGLSARLLSASERRFSLNISGGLAAPQAAATKGLVGLEATVMELLCLRASLRGDRMAGGVGVSAAGINFDYALVERDLGALHTISLTTHFGKLVSDRRVIRAERRETAFNRAMNDRLVEQNTQMARQLLQTGKTALASGDLTTADASFDRALFLARSTGIDTTEYAVLADQVRSQILLANRSIQLAQHLDSAHVHLDQRDYLGCQYFAGLALALDSTSTDAAALRDQAMQASAEQTRQQEFLQQKTWSIDSLIGYGASSEALAAARSLHSMAPDNRQVQLTLRKAEFEWFRSKAEELLADKDYQRSLNWIDSALVRFPGHAECLELRQTCRAALRAPKPDTASQPATAPTLSRALLKQVSDLYAEAQGAFGRGDLDQAIRAWEEVERLAPGYQSVRDYLLKAYRFVGADLYGRGRLDEAEVVWEKALKIAPGNAEIAAYARRTRSEIDKLKALTYDH